MRNNKIEKIILQNLSPTTYMKRELQGKHMTFEKNSCHAILVDYNKKCVAAAFYVNVS